MYKLLLKSILTALFFCAMSNYGTAQSWNGAGNGTSASPFLITSAAELDSVRLFMGGQWYFRLANDIDLTSYLALGGAGFAQWGGAGWLPIGDNSTNNWASRFGGNFDGNGKKIIGLWINRPASWSTPVPPYDVDHVGLFGAIGGVTAKIHNLGLEIAPQGITGRHKVGGLVGGAYSNATITKVYTTGTVNGYDYVGGIVGEGILANINNAYTTCNVTGTDLYIGGLIGIADNTTISNVYATGNVTGHGKIGGLAGVIVSNSSISYAYATGNVRGSVFVGGLVGEAQLNSSVKNCVVANGSIEATNSSALINRIASNSLIGSIFSNNYCVSSGMALIRASVSITETDNLNDIPGESKTLAALQTFDFYNTSGNWDGGSWNIALDNSLTWNIKNGSSFPFLSWQYAISASTLTPFVSLYEGYDTGAPAPQTVTITNKGLNAVTLIQPVSTNYAIGALSTTTLNAGQTATFTVCPKVGLTAGTYDETIIIYCNEGSSATVNVSFTVIIPPYITGDLFMTLTEGYSAISTNAYTIYGTAPVMVTKISGESLITWNNLTETIDIAAGLPVGDYEVKLRVDNNTASVYTFVFNLTVRKKVYLIDIPQIIVGGSLTVQTETPYLGFEGETVTLTVTPDKGYELKALSVYMSDASGNLIRSVVIPLKGSGNTYTFTMPVHNIAIEVSFRDNVGIENIRANSLNAFVQNDILYVSGLTAGEVLSIYNITGTLIYQGVTNSDKMEINLSGRGVYLIRSNNNTVKVVN